MPAYFNGVYGHKPTSNLISNYAQHPPATGLQDGIFIKDDFRPETIFLGFSILKLVNCIEKIQSLLHVLYSS